MKGYQSRVVHQLRDKAGNVVTQVARRHRNPQTGQLAMVKRRKANVNSVVRRPPGVQGRIINAITPYPVPVVRTSYATRNRRRSRNRRVPRGLGLRWELSPTDVAFLKAAFAAVDFEPVSCTGVPDGFSGPTVVRQDVQINTINIGVGKGGYILVPPTPGIAYFANNNITTPVTASTMGSTLLSGTEYASFTTLFSQAQLGTQTNSFLNYRVIGTALELRPQSAVTDNAGAILCAKLPFTVYDDFTPNTQAAGYSAFTGLPVQSINLNGLLPAALSSGPVYSGHPNDGLYSVGFNMGGWDFQQFFDGVTQIPPAQILCYNAAGAVSLQNNNVTNGALVGSTGTPLAIPGYSRNHECIGVYIQNSGAATLSLTLQTRQIIEYTPNPLGAQYEAATPSAKHSPAAMELYSVAVRNIPVAVEYARNDGFWDHLLRIWRGVLSVGSIVPVPGVNRVAASLDGLTNNLMGLRL